MSKVSLVKSTSHFQGVQDSLKLIKQDLEKKLRDLSYIVIKVNFVDANVKLATTPVESVQAFMDFVTKFYKGKIIIAEESSLGSAKQAFENYGFVDLEEKYSQVELLDLADDKSVEKRIKYLDQELTLSFHQTLLEAPFIVSVCRAKTHDTVVVTLAIKNLLVGGIQGALSERQKIHVGKGINDIMANIADLIYPDLAIVDGFIGMQGDGPCSGTAIQSNWALASLDALAADSLATYLMGFDVGDVEYLNLLREKDFGKLYPQDEIQVLGDSPEDLQLDFKPHQNFAYLS